MQPVAEQNRIESLDVIRGFSLLGILLINIIGFGLLNASHENPGLDLSGCMDMDMFAWASTSILGEGVMRTIFTILFGAGVILFTSPSRGKTAMFHIRRTFILLLFGLINAYVLIWNGDVLVTFALSGAFLYWLRNWKAHWLLLLACLIIAYRTFGTLSYGAELNAAREAIQNGMLTEANAWSEFLAKSAPSAAEMTAELAQRRESYISAFHWNREVNNFLYFTELRYWILDVLCMMLIGMALFKYRVIQGSRNLTFYIKLMCGGFTIGLSAKLYFVIQGINNNLDILAVNPYLQGTYDLGRLGMAFGFIGLLIWLLKNQYLSLLLRRFTEVGKMALTNYLMQSFICMFIFTGAGAALVGHLSRAELYPIALVIWIFQILFSHYWLRYYRYGPAEWVWRSLIYGEMSAIKRDTLPAS